MDVSAVNRIQSADFRPKADKIGLLVAQKTLESARQNQETGVTERTGVAKRHAHRPALPGSDCRQPRR